jgi:hypothetical protein
MPHTSPGCSVTPVSSRRFANATEKSTGKSTPFLTASNSAMTLTAISVGVLLPMLMLMGPRKHDRTSSHTPRWVAAAPSNGAAGHRNAGGRRSHHSG